MKDRCIIYTFMKCHVVRTCICERCNTSGGSVDSIVAQCHIATTHMHLLQCRSRASVDGIDFVSMSTRRTVVRIMASHLV